MEKPKIGQPCNGCGICCMKQVCRNGAYVLGLVGVFGETTHGPCPAIKKTPSGGVVCDIVLNPKKYIKGGGYTAAALSRNFATLIGAGTGCDELLDDDTQEEESKLCEVINEIKNNPEKMDKLHRAVRVIHGL